MTREQMLLALYRARKIARMTSPAAVHHVEKPTEEQLDEWFLQIETAIRWLEDKENRQFITSYDGCEWLGWVLE